jgi:hypothetical protein
MKQLSLSKIEDFPKASAGCPVTAAVGRVSDPALGWQ